MTCRLRIRKLVPHSRNCALIPAELDSGSFLPASYASRPSSYSRDSRILASNELIGSRVSEVTARMALVGGVVNVSCSGAYYVDNWLS